MENKFHSMCKIEKDVNNFCKEHSECKDCKSRRVLKRYYENKDKISNQRKIYYEKNKDRLLRIANARHIHFKELVRSYVELESRLKALERNFSINDSENIQVFKEEISSKPPKRNYITNKTDAYYIDGIWSLDMLDSKDYGPGKY